MLRYRSHQVTEFRERLSNRSSCSSEGAGHVQDRPFRGRSETGCLTAPELLRSSPILSTKPKFELNNEVEDGSLAPRRRIAQGRKLRGVEIEQRRRYARSYLLF